MKYSIKAFIKRTEKGWVADCLEVDVEVAGATLDETVENLRRELCARLHNVDLSTLGLVQDPILFVTLEDIPLHIRPYELQDLV